MWFLLADIVAQILNFGLPAPIDVQIVGSDRNAIFQYATKLLGALRKIPGLVDLRIQEPNDAPRLDITVDRTKASTLGLTEQNVANSVLGALSGSQQVSPNFWVDPTNGISYQLNAMVPQYDIDSPGALMNLPVLGSTTGQNQILANVASLSRSQTSPVMDRFNIRPVINIYGGVDGRDLGAVAREVRKAIDSLQKELPRGGVVTLRGQVATMQDSFFGLYVGLVFSMAPRLPSHGGKLPVVERAGYHYHSPARRSGRHHVDAFRHPNDAERAGADGCDHVHGRGDGQ